MVSASITISVIVVLVLALAGLWFLLLHKTKYKTAGIIVFGVLGWLGYTLMITHVYILDEDVEGGYYKQIALYQTEFELKNGEHVSVMPRWGDNHPTVINNTPTLFQYELHFYSTGYAPHPISSDLPPFSITELDNRLDYVFELPPDRVNVGKGQSSATRGVIN